MKVISTLIAVHDMELSKKFYSDVFGLSVEQDFGENVTLTGGVCLQTLNTWKEFIGADKNIVFKNNCGELYFEEDDIDSFYKKLESRNDIEFVHKLIEHSWGQRVVRLYDPDGHIIEVGENIVIVIKRFIKNGLTPEETAKRMDMPISYIRSVM